jgi:hypothetical protein
VSADARTAWRTLDYSTVLRVLDSILENETTDSPDPIGRATARQYAETLRRRYGAGARGAGLMANPFTDERTKFFLRHRREILEWSSIGQQVTTETDSALYDLLGPIRDRVDTLDAAAITDRLDGGQYRRILIRRSTWPEQLGVALEWQRTVDPFGSNLPKYGVFRNPADVNLNALFERLCQAFEAADFKVEGFKVPEGRAWVISRYVDGSDTWWQNFEEWEENLVTIVSDLFPRAAALVDHVLAIQP